ncbi:hypothetical protein AVEN_30112-1 [Araneus ventricosus]|uniref:Pre-C2HC domain-containing protein n=1 Tax=Araneus ventricosus TaxID=182803 RepID=A0A4Y2SXI1_ARAVE|nr:hypothetical protein AVEN_30112-1 [Araneus ventricosus]
MDLEEIKNDLVSKKFRVDKVNQLKKYKTREPLRIYHVHLLATENIKEIYSLKTIGYNIVSVQPCVRKQNNQCFNCQLWNHSCKGCRLHPKCVVCTGIHPSRDCPNKGKADTPIKCTNCNGPHTANYRGCPKYPKNIQKSKVQIGKARCTLADLVVGSNKCQRDTEAINDFGVWRTVGQYPHTSCRAKESQMTCPIQLLRTFPLNREEIGRL